MLFTAPTAIRGIRKEDPDGELPKRYDLSKFEALFLAGETLNHPGTAVSFVKMYEDEPVKKFVEAMSVEV